MTTINLNEGLFKILNIPYQTQISLLGHMYVRGSLSLKPK